MKTAGIYLSYLKSDQPWAERLAARLESAKLTVSNPPSGLPLEKVGPEAVREAILASSHTLVLIGPTTRFSRWVDREIELSTEPREEGPGAGLVGVILPEHEDFSRPYYDPANVPIRLHDLIQSEYALIRKWSEQPEEIQRWIEEAGRRRFCVGPEPSLGAAAQIYRFGWDESLDKARPGLEAL